MVCRRVWIQQWNIPYRVERMMNWAMLLLGIITYYSIGRRYQSAILIAMSLYVYWLVSQWSIVPIAIQSSVIVLSGLLIGKHPNKWLLVTAIISIILVFILLKEGVFRQKFPIGLSVVSSGTQTIFHYICPQLSPLLSENICRTH